MPRLHVLGIHEVLKEAIFKNWPKEFPDREAFPGFISQLLNMKPNLSRYMHTFLQTRGLASTGGWRKWTSSWTQLQLPWLFWLKANISELVTLDQQCDIITITCCIGARESRNSPEFQGRRPMVLLTPRSIYYFITLSKSLNLYVSFSQL